MTETFLLWEVDIQKKEGGGVERLHKETSYAAAICPRPLQVVTCTAIQMPIFMFHYVYAVTYEVAVQFDDAGHCAVYVYQVWSS